MKCCNSSQANSCLTGDCTASDCPYCADGPLYFSVPAFYMYVTPTSDKLHTMGRRKAIQMVIDIKFDHDIVGVSLSHDGASTNQ